ncbi:hypothetical protein PHISCL_10240 [Aspergillus sclerotialis]|uniref:Uncharacterized protein n=1 Tax=Aspergillus sclerotialis TaxID=2070753 RepID=A0A3A2Z5F9_9EURO|nr:hypothetical protein PHISCL_10240 [Aspergillus sclerotialis]
MEDMLENRIRELEIKLCDLFADEENNKRELREFKRKLQRLCDDYYKQQNQLYQQGYRVRAIIRAWFFGILEHGETTLQERWKNLTDPIDMAEKETKTNTSSTYVSGKDVPA